MTIPMGKQLEKQMVATGDRTRSPASTANLVRCRTKLMHPDAFAIATIDRSSAAEQRQLLAHLHFFTRATLGYGPGAAQAWSLLKRC